MTRLKNFPMIKEDKKGNIEIKIMNISKIFLNLF